MTCKCNDDIKIFTIRGTAFEAAKTSGGGAASENGKGIVYTCTCSRVWEMQKNLMISTALSCY